MDVHPNALRNERDRFRNSWLCAADAIYHKTFRARAVRAPRQKFVLLIGWLSGIIESRAEISNAVGVCGVGVSGLNGFAGEKANNQDASQGGQVFPVHFFLL